jgi:competence protein ComEC
MDSKNKTLLACCFCFLFSAGITSLFSFDKNHLLYFYLMIFCLLFLLILFFEKKIFRFVLLIFLFLIFGIARVLLKMPVIDENHVAFYQGGKYEIIAVVSDEPNVKTNSREYVLQTRELQRKDRPKIKINGKIILRTLLYPEYNYGDELRLTCSLKEIKNSENFNYKKFLAVKDVYASCYPQNIELLSTGQGNKVLGGILKLKNRVNNLTQQLWGEPQRTLAAGILYGERSGFDQETKDNFARSGITHIVAVSGYNITIIVWILMSLLIYIGLYRQQAFWVCLFLIFAFVIFTGASASAMRAGLMGSILLFAQFLGRKSSAFNLLVYAAVFLTALNPFVLIWDVGFQLSFLATVGLIYLTPLLEKKILPPPLNPSSGRRGYVRFDILLKDFLIPTLAATVFTLPLISYSFGFFSIFSIPANLLIIWLIPFLMFLSFISILLAFVFFPFGQVLAWFTNLGLSYVIMIGEKFGSWSFSVVSWQIPLLVCLMCYVGLFKIIAKNPKL